MGWVDRVVIVVMMTFGINYCIRHIPMSRFLQYPLTFFHQWPLHWLAFYQEVIVCAHSSLSIHLNYHFRLPCLSLSTRSHPVQYASNESNHDRRWNCVMEKERRRNLLDGRGPPRNCKSPSHVFSSSLTQHPSTSGD